MVISKRKPSKLLNSTSKANLYNTYVRRYQLALYRCVGRWRKFAVRGHILNVIDKIIVSTSDKLNYILTRRESIIQVEIFNASDEFLRV